MAVIIDGKEVAREKREQIKNRVESLKSQGKTVGLAVIIVGENPASRVYVNNKKKGCLEVGIESFEYALPENTTEQESIFSELREIQADETAIEDRFYKELEFGTGGLRGVLGAGTNRMNVYTVAKATQGYSNYLKKQTKL